jgi:2-methylcitrate dehydratase PrpD
LGVFGAAAGAARLLDLTPAQTATALSIAVSLSCGVKANFGTMTKPLHVGVCGRNGLYAALLAREGFTAHAEAFEHGQGFFELFNGAGNYDAAKALAAWADPLDILNPGVGLKQYPCCASTHSSIDAMIILKQKYGLTPEMVARIETVTHERALVHTNRPQPNSTLDAKFSVQYCVVRALMHGDVKFDHFDGDAYRDPAVRKLLERVTARTHAHKAKGMRDHYEGKVRVTTTDGRVLEAAVDLPLRGPTNLAPPDRLNAKFVDCASRALRADAVERVLALMNRFETLDDTRQLTDAMAEGVKSPAAERAAA